MHPIVIMLDQDIEEIGEQHRTLCRQKDCIEYAAGPRFHNLRDEIEQRRVELIAKQQVRSSVARVLRVSTGSDPASLVDDALRILAEASAPLPPFCKLETTVGKESAADVWRIHHRHHGVRF